MKKLHIVAGAALVIAGLWLGIGTFIHAVYYAPVPEQEVASESPFFLATSSVPTRIQIPSIGVDAAVEQVGLTYIGNMSTPKILSDTGWYKYGTLPGKNGSAVIDGHVDNGLGLSGVFKNLKNTQIGDDVYVTTNAGATLHFKIIDIETYYYKDVPLQLLFNRTGDAYLNLITCDGAWVTADKTDDHRIVVFTKLVN